MASKEWRAKQKEALSGIRSAFFAKCISCGTTKRCHRSPIDAHHYLPLTKVHVPSDLIRKKYPIRVVLRELLKCIPLCRQCHVKIHERRIMPMKDVFNFTRWFMLRVIEEHGVDYLDFLPGYPRVERNSWEISDFSAMSHNSYVVSGLLHYHVERIAHMASLEPDFQKLWTPYYGDQSLLALLSWPYPSIHHPT